MKLADTYTNMCFIAILINIFIKHLQDKDSHRDKDDPLPTEIPLYMFIVSLASAGVYVLSKIGLLIYLMIFTCRDLTKLTSKNEPLYKKQSQSSGASPDVEKHGQVDKMTNDIKAHLEQTMERSRIQKTLVYTLLWLDLETFAKLYDGEERSETAHYQSMKTRYAFLKILIEDLPICAMQALFL